MNIRIRVLLLYILLVFPQLAQQLQHDAVAVNVEVSVRVFDSDIFVGDLSIDDFELYENGKLQKIGAVYLIKKTTIEKEESELEPIVARQKFSPVFASRTIVLFFEIIDYVPQIGEAIDYFFKEVFSPSDTLITVTPMKTYRTRGEILSTKSKERLATELKGKLRRDTRLGNAEYKSILRDIQSGWYSPMDIQRLRNLRYLDPTRLREFSNYLKNIEEQKHVFLFFQRGVLPDYVPDGELDITYDAEKIKTAFSDSLITVHFLFLTAANQMDPSLGSIDRGFIRVKDESTTVNIFSAFSELSQATGGLRESSSNPIPIFKKALRASENYYLLYYTPKEYRSDGKFRKLKIRIKGQNYKVLHRAGYIAD